MKKAIKILALATAMCAILAISAVAADFEHCADAMNGLGLFRGTQNGYELDREPTRAEAATMLVRLLGAEEEALALTYTAPYTDVEDWAKPYVQYLQDKGLTKGTSATTFGYSEKCTAQQYATFLLRALGYSDSVDGDFTYAEAMKFAKDKGVVDGMNCSESLFLRDHVAAMSYTALATAPKSGEADLLTKLAASGAIADAKGMDELFANYRALNAKLRGFETATKLSADVEMNISVKVEGKDYIKVEQKIAMASDINLENADRSRMSYDGKMTTSLSPELFPGQDVGNLSTTENVKYYYTDGNVYMDIGGEKLKTAMSFDSVYEKLAIGEIQSGVGPISTVKSIEVIKSTAAAEERYTAVCASSALDSAIDNADAAQYNEAKLEVAVHNNKLTSLSVSADAETQEEGVTLNTEAALKIKNIRMDGDVKVKLPTDLDTYAEE